MSTKTTKVDDGGPAFPVEVKGERMGDGHREWYSRVPMPGMSLRDYFAAQVMGHIIVSPSLVVDGSKIRSTRHAATVAYQCADAMLEARKGGEE